MNFAHYSVTDIAQMLNQISNAIRFKISIMVGKIFTYGNGNTCYFIKTHERVPDK